MLSSATSLHTKALSAHNLGHPARALRLLQRALQQLDKVPEAAASPAGEALAAAIWISLALNVAEVQGLEPGLIALQEAQRRAEQIGDPALQVRVHSNHAQIATRAGKFDLALAQFAAAVELLDFADAPDHFGVLLNSGNLRLFRGELAEAARLFDAAVVFARAQNLPVAHFMALHNVGFVEFLAGNLPQALRAMDTATALDVPISQGVALLDRARILVESGLAREADEALATAAQIFAADRSWQDLGEVEVSRAECALLEGDVVAARRFAAQARNRFRRRGNDRWRRTAELVLLQGDLAAGRPGLRLAPVALRLEAELRADGLHARATTAALVAAEALLTADRPAQAASTLVAGAATSGSAPIAVRLHARYVRARLEIATGNRSAALRHAHLGLAELAEYQASFGGIDLRTASAVHGRRLAQLDLSVAVEQGRPASVLAAVERGRAVSSRLAAVVPPADDRSATLLAELRQVVEAARAQHGGDAALEARRRDLERQIKARAWAVAGGGPVRRPASLAQVRAGAESGDACVLVYVHDGPRLLAVSVDAARARLHELGPIQAVEDLIRRARADLDVLAYDTLPVGLRAAAAGSLSRSLRRLDDILLRPLGVDGRRLVVVPTGLLGALPWPLLPSRAGCPVVVAPSATAWLSGQSGLSGLSGQSAEGADGDGRPHTMAAFAGPDLGRARDEVAAIAAARGDCEAHIGAAADRDALTRAMGAATVVHVAAHGQHRMGNPLFSSLRLADGALFAHELDRSAPHVVLSACELGLATVRAGDEALGLTSVLLHLGTRSVVSGVARVSDAAAAQAMVRYHRLLGQGCDTAEALADAVAHAAQPLPFVCFGAEWKIPVRAIASRSAQSLGQLV